MSATEKPITDTKQFTMIKKDLVTFTSYLPKNISSSDPTMCKICPKLKTIKTPDQCC